MSKIIPLNNLDILLASEAKWRSDLLTRNNIPHRCKAHKFDEPEYIEGSLPEFVKMIAQEKGRSIQADHPESLIISADQLISINNQVLGKPDSFERAQEQLKAMNGQTHRLICAVAVTYQNRVEVACEEAHLKMRHLTTAERDNYLGKDRPFDCAGSYKIESLGASLFEEISVKDPGTIIGIPMNLLVNILRNFGFSNLL